MMKKSKLESEIDGLKNEIEKDSQVLDFEKNNFINAIKELKKDDKWVNEISKLDIEISTKSDSIKLLNKYFTINKLLHVVFKYLYLLYKMFFKLRLNP